jgi:hypothetical protein
MIQIHNFLIKTLKYKIEKKYKELNKSQWEMISVNTLWSYLETLFNI